MNNSQRKELDRAIALLQEAQEIIGTISEEEGEKFENAPENLQESEKFLAMETASENLDTIKDDIETMVDEIEESKES